MSTVTITVNLTVLINNDNYNNIMDDKYNNNNIAIIIRIVICINNDNYNKMRQ